MHIWDVPFAEVIKGNPILGCGLWRWEASKMLFALPAAIFMLDSHRKPRSPCLTQREEVVQEAQRMVNKNAKVGPVLLLEFGGTAKYTGFTPFSRSLCKPAPKAHMGIHAS